MRQRDMDELQRKIEYHFKSPRILCEALHPAGTAPLQGNKRLALVGDSALALSILDESYQRKETVGMSFFIPLTTICFLTDGFHRQRQQDFARVCLQLELECQRAKL